MSTNITGAIDFVGYWVSDLTFRRNPVFNHNGEITLDVNFGVGYEANRDDPSNVLVNINCEVFSDNFSEERNPFHLQVTVVGEFRTNIDSSIDLEEEERAKIEYLMKANTVAILFPYVRTAITSITAANNVPPVVLPTVNTYALLEASEHHTD